MKIHITNLYNFNPNDELVQKQHRFADAGRELGFSEMGIFSYPVETDTPSELNKRLDGIIAALEPEDVVFMQLPTKNGYAYENLLFNKIKAYRNTKVILILHDLDMLSANVNNFFRNQYIDFFKQSDAIIAPSVTSTAMFESHGFSNLLFYDKARLAEKESTSRSDSTHIEIELEYTNSCAPLYKMGFYSKKILMDALELVFPDSTKQISSNSPIADNEIQIGFGLHDKTGNYSVWVGVTMQSIIESTNAKICFHILHDSTLSTENKNKLMKIASTNGHRAQFHFIDASLFANMSRQIARFTIGTMFRILLPEILPELSKIIYLDADLIVNRDINELWETNISDYYLAAAPDMEIARGAFQPLPVQRGKINAKQYFNAGVLFLNLALIRKKGNMKDAVMNYLEETQEYDFPDQNALNVIYKDKIFLLDENWNYFSLVVRRNMEKSVFPRIYHYASERFYIRTINFCDMDFLGFDILRRTPWGNSTYTQMLKASYERVSERTKLIQKIMPLVVTDKKRIFYGTETYAMKNLFNLISVRKDDYRILSEPFSDNTSILPCKKLSHLEKEEKGTYILFVLPEADNGNSIRNLESMGLQVEKDFFIIPCILPPEQGGYV